MLDDPKRGNLTFFRSLKKRGNFEVQSKVHISPISQTLRQLTKKVHTIESLKLYHYAKEELVQLTQLSLPSFE